MFIRLAVAILVITPLVLVFGLGEWYFTFLIALIGFGAGHLVEMLVKKSRQPPETDRKTSEGEERQET